MYNYITAKKLYFFLKLLYLFIDVFIPIIYFYVCHFASSMDLKRHDAASFYNCGSPVKTTCRHVSIAIVTDAARGTKPNGGDVGYRH